MLSNYDSEEEADFVKRAFALPGRWQRGPSGKSRQFRAF
jgi:hypothetical protein